MEERPPGISLWQPHAGGARRMNASANANPTGYVGEAALGKRTKPVRFCNIRESEKEMVGSLPGCIVHAFPVLLRPFL